MVRGRVGRVEKSKYWPFLFLFQKEAKDEGADFKMVGQKQIDGQKAVLFGVAGFVCGLSIGLDIAERRSEEGIREIADEIREYGHAQIWCSDEEPICVRKE